MATGTLYNPRAQLTASRTGLYSLAMNDTTRTQLDLELTRLAKRIEELLAMVEHLREENRALRTRHESLAGERAALMHKNEQVRTRVEAMIGRLKTLEHGA
jgi:cell division protein ZapB